MRERGRGHLALMSSVAGYNGLPLAAPYSASKAAVINLAESLRFGLARAGIKVSFIAPGFVRTPLTETQPVPDAVFDGCRGRGSSHRTRPFRRPF
jgi:NAD(P)-dependent dehydrogenase (short-subunit alcohol dehydrogenase family)